MPSLLRTRGGLGKRLASLLAAALLPIGLVAMLQNVQLARDAAERSESSLIALTSEAVNSERAFLSTALGVARVIGTFAPVFNNSPTFCERMLSEFINVSGDYTFVGFIDRSGVIACSSSGQNIDVSANLIYQRMLAHPEPIITPLDRPSVSTVPVNVLSVPVFQDGQFYGFVSVSAARRNLSPKFENNPDMKPLEIVTYNARGELLSSIGGAERLEDVLPKGLGLAQLANFSQAFSGTTRDGEKREFAVATVVPDLVYALGVWEPQNVTIWQKLMRVAGPLLFPMSMWLASLAVAFFAVERLVIRPVRNLRARMLIFMRSRAISDSNFDRHTPTELREMDDTWQMMAQAVVREEAELENSIHEKNVLLKEVHHRVKNNLQLISSMLSMKMRGAKTAEARSALRDVQGRVMSLATVHQKLFQVVDGGKIETRSLVSTIVNHVSSASAVPNQRVKITQNLAEIDIYPDQAVPLSLAVSETMTNALKYIGHEPGNEAWLTVDLTREGADRAKLVIANSIGSVSLNDYVSEGTGLGRKLILSFVGQLDGTAKFETEDGAFRVSISFPISEFHELPDGDTP